MRYVKTVTVTPLNSDGSISTLMATGYQSKDVRNAVSTGHHPAPILIEVWECEDGESVPVNADVDEFIKYMKVGRYRGRKIENSARSIILRAAAELSERQFFRFRRLTPLEILRLQGVIDNDAQTMMSVNDDEQIYKQAGNSICVPVLRDILYNLFNLK